MCLSFTCYICTSERMLEEGMANQVTIGCFCFALSYESLDWMIWKLELSLRASGVGCSMHHERICTSHFRIQPSWVERDHNNRKSFYWRNVTRCYYWIISCIFYTYSLVCLFIASCSQNSGQSQSPMPLCEFSKVLPYQMPKNIFSSCCDLYTTCFQNPAMECRYWIKLGISFTHSPALSFITSCSQNRGQNQSTT